MEEFVKYLVQNLVSNPDGVSIQSSTQGNIVLLELQVDQADIGKVVGKRGRTINSIRTLTSTIGARLGQHVRVELVEKETEQAEQLG